MLEIGLGFIYTKSQDLSYDVYNFITGNTVIGLSINGNNYYITDNNPITSDKVLNGYQVYTKGYQPITGTMSNNGDVTIAPTTSEQVKEKGYYNSLKVSAVTSAIDSNITPENIKKDVSILGVTGTLEEGTDTSDATLQANKNATPTTSQQVITPDTGYDGMKQVTIAPAVMSTEDYDTCMDLADYIMYGEQSSPYTELEYIQGTGVQYLDTGITPKATQRIEIEVQLDAVTAWERLFGVTNNGAVTRANVFANDPDNQGKMDFFVVKFRNVYEEDDVPVKIPMVINTKYKVDVNYATKEVKLDDVSLGHVTEAPVSDTRTIQVFSGADSDVDPAKMKLYSFKIYEGDELVLDLIPVKRNSDNVVCAYDTVSETYFTNEGTGVFTAGAEKEVV